MERFWQKNYQQGVPTEIDLNTYESLGAVIEDSCQKAAGNSAFRNMGTDISYLEVDSKSLAVASYLRNVLCLKKGDRVAIMMPNLLQYPVVLFGILRAGLIVVNVNPLYTFVELTHILKDSGAKAIIILANFANVLQRTLPNTSVEHVIVTEVGDLFPRLKKHIVNFAVRKFKGMVPHWEIPGAISLETMLNDGSTIEYKAEKITQEDIAFLQYTGGTTGVPKGAVLTHGNMIANILQMKAWADHVLSYGKETIITALPLYHIFSLTVNCLTYLTSGSLNILITNPRDLSRFIREIKNVKFTAITGVNTLYKSLMNHPKFKNIDFSRLRFSMSGGMAVQKSVADKWHRITKCPLVEGYGLTEASPLVCANLINAAAYSGGIGFPVSSTDVSIRDDKGMVCAFDEIGELYIKGPQIIKEYWKNAEETKKAFSKDGWFKTGDVVKMTKEGFMYLVDRKKDMVIVSGFNVYPSEVENVILKHPGVLDVAVTGVQDEKTGEVVKAFVVKKDRDLGKEELVAFCRESLTRYKVPKQIAFVDELPKTHVGKILKRKLREL